MNSEEITTGGMKDSPEVRWLASSLQSVYYAAWLSLYSLFSSKKNVVVAVSTDFLLFLVAI